MWKLSPELKVKNIPYIFKNRYNRELIFLATPNNDRISKYRREKRTLIIELKQIFMYVIQSLVSSKAGPCVAKTILHVYVL